MLYSLENDLLILIFIRVVRVLKSTAEVIQAFGDGFSLNGIEIGGLLDLVKSVDALATEIELRQVLCLSV